MASFNSFVVFSFLLLVHFLAFTYPHPYFVAVASWLWFSLYRSYDQLCSELDYIQFLRQGGVSSHEPLSLHLLNAKLDTSDTKPKTKGEKRKQKSSTRGATKKQKGSAEADEEETHEKEDEEKKSNDESLSFNPRDFIVSIELGDEKEQSARTS